MTFQSYFSELKLYYLLDDYVIIHQIQCKKNTIYEIKVTFILAICNLLRYLADSVQYHRITLYGKSIRELTPCIAPVDIRRTVHKYILAFLGGSHQLASASLSQDKIGADTSILAGQLRRRHRRLRHPRRLPPPRRQLLPPRSMGTSPTITPGRAQ